MIWGETRDPSLGRFWGTVFRVQFYLGFYPLSSPLPPNLLSFSVFPAPLPPQCQHFSCSLLSPRWFHIPLGFSRFILTPKPTQNCRWFTFKFLFSGYTFPPPGSCMEARSWNLGFSITKFTIESLFGPFRFEGSEATLKLLKYNLLLFHLTLQQINAQLEI